MLRNVIFDWPGALADDLGVSLLPHALEFLHFCQSTQRRRFVLTAIDGTDFTAQSARLGVAQFLERSYAGVTDKRGRILNILAENNLSAGETALIGNTRQDIEAAKSGGVMAIATLTDHLTGDTPDLTGPDIVIRNLDELRRLLEASPARDEIRIEQLELMAHVGVQDDERAQLQRLVVSIGIQPRHLFASLDDALTQTVDYAAVCSDVQEFVSARRDKLIETLAHAIAEHLLQRYRPLRIAVEVRKFILPETRYVAVRVERESPPR